MPSAIWRSINRRRGRRHRVLASILRGGISGATARILDTLSADALQTAWMITRRWTDSNEVAIHLLQLPMKGRRAGSAFLANPGVHRVMLVRELAFRGHLTAAFEALGTNIGPLEADSFGSLATMGGVPADTAAAVFARWLHDRSIWYATALPWWAARADTASLIRATIRAEDELAAAASPLARRDWSYRASAARAYLSLARHSTDALTRFQQLPDSLCAGCYLDRLTKSRVLDSLGKHAEAEAALMERPHVLLSPVEVTVASARATVAEKLQHYETAARAYEFVARAWSSGDAELQAHATQASMKAGQLAGDQPQGARLSPSR